MRTSRSTNRRRSRTIHDGMGWAEVNVSSSSQSQQHSRRRGVLVLSAMRELGLVMATIAVVALLAAWAGLHGLESYDDKLHSTVAWSDEAPVEAVYGMALLDGGERIVSFGRGSRVDVSDARTGARLQTLESLLYKVTSVAADADGRRLLVGHVDGGLIVWLDVAAAEPHYIMAHPEHMLWSVQFSSDGRRFLTAGEDHCVKIWDADTFELQRQIDMQSGHCRVVRFLPGGDRVIGGGTDGAIHIWNAETGRKLQSWAGHSAMISSMDCSPDGRLLVTLGLDGAVRGWNLRTGRQIWESRLEAFIHRGVAFSPDGRLLAVSSSEGRICLCQPQTGRIVGELEGHRLGLRGLQFLPDGKGLLSCGFDGVICRWNVQTQAIVWRSEPRIATEEPW